MSNKVINLKNDPIFRRAVEYNDQKNYEGEMIMPFDSAVSNSVKDRADSVKDAIFDLMLAGELDAMDIAIIQARDCSPMPSIREVARALKIDAANVSRRAQHIRSLIAKACAIKN